MSRFYRKHYIQNDKCEDIYFRMFFKEGKILDIGCSTGNFLAQCKGGMGIDIDEGQLDIARKRGFKVQRVDVNGHFPFKDGPFDAINCRHVIEHLDRPLEFMEECYRILRKGGKLVLMTPNMRRDKEHFWHDYTHKRPFIRESLSKIAYDAGFENYDAYNFVEGLPMMRVFYERGLISPQTIKGIEKIAGRIFGKVLILEAVK